MGIRSLYRRTYGLLVQPAREFTVIADENRTVAGINSAVVIPYALSVALFALLGSLFQHLESTTDSYLFILTDAVIVFFIILLQTYLSGLIIVHVARWMNLSTRRRKVYAMVAYSEIPFYIMLALVKLFPYLIFLIFLGMYSAYLLYTAAERLFRTTDTGRVQFLLISMVVMVGMFIMVSELFSYLYTEFISLFTTFAIL